MEIGRSDYRVQAQSGYYNPKAFGDYSDVEKELHLFDLALSEKPAAQAPLLFPMRTLLFASQNDTGVLMMAKIPADVIAKFSGRRIELVTLVLDEQDNPVDRRQTKPDPAKARDRDVVFTSEAFLGPGAYRCRIIVRDLESGEAALAYASATIPAKAAGAGLKLFTPLLLTAYRPTLPWEGLAKKSGRRWMDVYGYDPALYSPLAGDAPAGTRTLYAVVPYALAGTPQASVALRAMLIDAATGNRSELSFSVLGKTRKEGQESRLLECGLDGVPAGKYLFYVYAENEATRAVSYAQTALTIR